MSDDFRAGFAYPFLMDDDWIRGAREQVAREHASKVRAGGAEAFASGKPIDANPYVDNTSDCADWLHGFVDAEIRAR